jgi:hypothetical protein
LYVVAQFFFNFGPNVTTLIVPSECFPTRYRSTTHGFSGASGKIGSIVAQAGIAQLLTRGATETNSNPWLNHVLEIFALFLLLGVFTSLCIPETKRITLENLLGEQEMIENLMGPSGGRLRGLLDPIIIDNSPGFGREDGRRSQKRFVPPPPFRRWSLSLPSTPRRFENSPTQESSEDGSLNMEILD